MNTYGLVFLIILFGVVVLLLRHVIYLLQVTKDQLFNSRQDHIHEMLDLAFISVMSHSNREPLLVAHSLILLVNKPNLQEVILAHHKQLKFDDGCSVQAAKIIALMDLYTVENVKLAEQIHQHLKVAAENIPHKLTHQLGVFANSESLLGK